ncbi:apolipoprotein N-acyltransferase [Mucilaginibacter yixingensis]|uniref:Apolipoprotein N-acyltransferase n=1 Tax=Mucilaginibacter yixingensis TaxID=1295612 RepID=A0A2T5JCY2_9SPHI|nr:apolipoprotein N-acyltransferase [Mucilaginibacter yixingensis]PTQ99620.1 apolipoprotein N-acyltransferase [Mucilaginibacter yixingensis]
MKKNLLLSVLSGLLLWIAWPPTPYTTFLLFVGLVPMLVVMENIIRSDTPKKGKKLFWTTFLGFFIWNTLSIYWVYNALKDIGEVAAIPVTLIPYALGPLLMSGACWLYYRFRLQVGRSLSLVAFVCFWLGYEYLHQNWALNFPWMTLGNGFALVPGWVQWYEFTGAYGGSVWVLAVNILLFLIYIGLNEPQGKAVRVRLIIAVLLVLGLPIGWSINRYSTYEEERNPSNVVVVQPNIDPYAKFNEIPAAAQLDILTHLSDSLAQVNTEYFIWPETAIASSTDEDRIRTNPYYTRVQHFLDKYKNGNVLSGIESYKIYPDRSTETASPLPGGGGFYDNFNAAINIENSAEVQFYHKSKLVPGAETIPFGSTLSFLKPIFEHLGGAAGSYGADKDVKVFYSQSGIGVDPVICYESIYGEYVARAVRKGAQFIAIVTNDGWWGNTSGKDQHIDYARLRAIETRRWVCRSANTGISGFINQRGDVVQHSKWWVRTALKQDINLNSDLTFYVKYGDYLPRIFSMLAVAGVVFIVAGIRRKPNQQRVIN